MHSAASSAVEIYKVLDEPKRWRDQLHLKGVKGKTWARPKRKSKSLLIPLDEGKDLATVRSSCLSRNHQNYWGARMEGGKRDEEDK